MFLERVMSCSLNASCRDVSLGCGDGRVITAATRTSGCRGRSARGVFRVFVYGVHGGSLLGLLVFIGFIHGVY